MVTREFLSPADLSGAQTLCVYKPAEVVVVGEYENLMFAFKEVPLYLEGFNNS